MRLPHLDQIMELERGEAGQLWWAIAEKWARTIAVTAAEPPEPVEAMLLLALPVLQRVAKRLYTIDQRELSRRGKPAGRPQRFRLRHDELIVIMRFVATERISLARVPLGKVQQKSLNLEHYITF